VLDAPRSAGWRWTREGALVASMLLGLFAYAPVRLLWPITVVILAMAAVIAPERRRIYVLTSLGCLAVVPAVVMAQEAVTTPDPEPASAALGYFHARGEQIAAMSEDPSAAGQYVRDFRADDAEGSVLPATVGLVTQNARDLINLLLDAETRPVLTDFWNESGRFWPWFYLPFAIIGSIAALGHALRWRNRPLVRLLPILLVLGLALPLLLTSRVHVGRLLPALPFALLLVAMGVAVAATQVCRVLTRWSFSVRPALVGFALAAGVLFPASWLAGGELAVALTPTREEQTVQQLADWVDPVIERRGAVLVEDPSLGDEIERVHAATYQLALNRHYQFVDLTADDEVPADGRAQIFWRGALAALRTGAIAAPCDRLWFATPEVSEAFLGAWRDAGCSGVPDLVRLP
jgi:hypothetical protein